MANSDKDIVIRPRTGDASLNPVIEFVGADSGTGPQTITATVTPADQGTVTLSGTSGTILTISDNATDKLNVNGNVTVGGNLTVSGTTTTVNTETINLADNIILLNSNETGTPSENAGIEIERGTSTNVVLQWNETSDHWEIASGGTTGRILTTGDEGAGNGLYADRSSTIDTLTTATNADFFLTFVDSNTSVPAQAKTLNTDSGIKYNPNTNTFTVTSISAGGDIDASGDILADGRIILQNFPEGSLGTDESFLGDFIAGDGEFRGDVEIGTSTSPTTAVIATTGITFNVDVTVDGEVTAVDFNSTSDQALKDNVVTIEDASEKVARLRGVNFDWRENGKPAMGVIAQEVEAVIPEVVSSNGEHKTVNYGSIVGVLIEAIKDLQNKVNELENKIKE